MPANPNFSTSVTAEKAAALKDYAALLDLEIEEAAEQSAGYRIAKYDASVRPQDGGDLEGPWTICCPADQEPKLRELLDKSPEFIE